MTVAVTEHTIHIAIVEPEERLDVFHASSLSERLEALFAAGHDHLVLDLTAVSFIDSAAIAVMVRTLKEARRRNGSLQLVWPQSASARRIFRLTQFDRVFAMTDTIAEAMATFQGVRP